MSEGCMSETYFSKKVTFFNVALTLLIVLLHAKTPERWGLELTMDYPLIYLVSTLCQISIPLFFFISGLLFYRNCSFSCLRQKLRSRARSLLVPYLLWNIIYVSIYFVLTHISFTHGVMNMGEALNSPREILVAVINSRFSVLWFIKDLLVFTVLSPLILVVLRNAWFSALCLCVLIVLSLTIDTGYESLLKWAPIYFQGAMLGHWGFKDGEYLSFDRIIKTQKAQSMCSVAIILTLTVLFGVTVADESAISLFRLSSPILLWILCDFIFQDFIINKFHVKAWMKYTFFIYCTHKFILDVMQKICVITLPPSHLVLNIVFMLTPALTIPLIVVVADNIHDSKLYQLLCGGR